MEKRESYLSQKETQHILNIVVQNLKLIILKTNQLSWSYFFKDGNNKINHIITQEIKFLYVNLYITQLVKIHSLKKKINLILFLF